MKWIIIVRIIIINVLIRLNNGGGSWNGSPRWLAPGKGGGGENELINCLLNGADIFWPLDETIGSDINWREVPQQQKDWKNDSWRVNEWRGDAKESGMRRSGLSQPINQTIYSIYQFMIIIIMILYHECIIMAVQIIRYFRPVLLFLFANWRFLRSSKTKPLWATLIASFASNIIRGEADKIGVFRQNQSPM